MYDTEGKNCIYLEYNAISGLFLAPQQKPYFIHYCDNILPYLFSFFLLLFWILELNQKKLCRREKKTDYFVFIYSCQKIYILFFKAKP